MFPLGSLPNSCSQPWKLCRWLCRWLSRGLAEAYLTGCPAACSSSLLSGCSSRQHSVSHERVLHRWNAFFLCWCWENVSVNTDELSLCAWGTGVAICNRKTCLQPVSCFHLSLSLQLCPVLMIELCTRVNPTYSSFFLSVSLSVVKALKSSGCFWVIWMVQYGLLADTCICPVFMSYSFPQKLWNQNFSFS